MSEKLLSPKQAFYLKILRTCVHNEIYSLFQLSPKFFNPGTGGYFYKKIGPLIKKGVFIQVQKDPPRYKYDENKFIKFILSDQEFVDFLERLGLRKVIL